LEAKAAMSLLIRKTPHNIALRQRIIGNQKRITFTFIVLLIFALAILLNHVFLHMQLLELVNKKEALKMRIVALEKLKDKYQQEEVMLSSLQRIEFIAKEQLGMIVPARKDRIYLTREDGSK